MKTLVTPQEKITLVSFNKFNVNPQDRFNNLKETQGTKFYQNIFLVFLGLSIFLIFPESPQESESLCKKYNSEPICKVW